MQGFPSSLISHTKPTHFPTESKLMAMAEPMTSCMSEPMMASSTISHRMIRGNWGGKEHPVP